MKNIVIAVALLTATLVAAGRQESDMGKTVIGIVQNNVGIDTYQTTYADTLNKISQERSDVETIILDAAGDVTRQSSQVQDLIQQQVSAIIVWPTNGQAIIPAIKKAYEKNIPVVITNSKLAPEGEKYMASFSGPDNIRQGKYAAQLMNEALKGKGVVVQITGLPGYTTAIERQQGFEEELMKIAPGIKILDTQPGDWNREKSQRVMENFLTKYDRIDGVYAADDNMGIGALNAAKTANRAQGMIFVGATNFAVGYDAIKAGEYYGSVSQSPVTDAENAFATAIKIVNNETLPKYNYFDTPKITAANLNEFQRPVF